MQSLFVWQAENLSFSFLPSTPKKVYLSFVEKKSLHGKYVGTFFLSKGPSILKSPFFGIISFYFNRVNSILMFKEGWRMVIVITEKIGGGAVNGFFKRLSKGFVFYISNLGCTWNVLYLTCAIDFQLFYDPLSKHKIRQEQDQHWQQGANGNFQFWNGDDCTFRDSWTREEAISYTRALLRKINTEK